MEKGQGITLAMKYRVTGFPSYLIFSPEGKLVYKTFGYQKAPDFLKNLNNSITPGLEQFYNGISDEPELNFPDFYRNAFAGNGKRIFPDSIEIDSYFRTENNWFSEVSFSILSRFEVPDTVNRFFLKNIEQYRYLYSIDADDKISGMIYRLMSKAVKNKDMDLAGEAFSMIDMYIKEDRNEIKQSYLLMYLSETSDWKNFYATFQKVLDTEGYKNSEMINNYAWDIYKKCDDPDVISKAAEWMKNVTDADPQYMFLDTYAALLYKSKNYTEAEIYAKKAIKTGKKNKEDIKETKELLEKIKQMRKNRFF
jgi:tetratricopeptide (TPR) repeat protein